MRGLLEAHGVPSVVSSDAAAVDVSAVGRTASARSASPCIPSDADEARRIIESHRTELQNGAGRAAARRVRDAAARDRLPLPRSRAARARDDAHVARQRGRQRRRRRQRVDGVSRRRGARLRHRRPAVPRVSRSSTKGRSRRSKASLVSTTTLARQAERLSLGDHLLLGRGEEKTGGRHKQALLADGYEALIAAIYLDGGIEHARAFIAREFAPLIAELRPTARRRAGLQVGAAGAAAVARPAAAGVSARRHARSRSPEAVSRSRWSSSGEALGRGDGPSKKEAEQEAARRGAGQDSNRS